MRSQAEDQVLRRVAWSTTSPEINDQSPPKLAEAPWKELVK
jgi:hypothetical protein